MPCSSSQDPRDRLDGQIATAALCAVVRNRCIEDVIAALDQESGLTEVDVRAWWDYHRQCDELAKKVPFVRPMHYPPR